MSATGTPLAGRDSSTISVTIGGGSQESGDEPRQQPSSKTLPEASGGSSSKDSSLEFDGLIDLKSLSFNTVDGFVAGTAMSLSTKSGGQGRFTLAPSVKYAFSRQSLMWNVSANLLYDPYRSGNIYLRAGSLSDEFSPSGVNPLVNTVSSLFFRENWMKLYSSKFLIAGHRGDLANGLNLEVSAMYEKRDPLDNNTSFSFFRRDYPYSVNAPDNAYLTGEVEGYEPLTLFSHSNLSLTTGLAWTPRQRYRLSGGAKIYAGSDYPTFKITWKHGYNYNDTLAGNFDMLMGEIFRTSSFGPLNEFQWHIRGGGFFNSHNVEAAGYALVQHPGQPCPDE
ncbi:MAG: DUF5686 family protein [Bacteroidales bacterium]|nr:DUF5686 family protein [Bacteroidales bacterium]